MRYALISDIHGNLPALEAVCAHIADHSPVDVVYHLGDLVGYAPWPNEVVDLLLRHRVPGVAGNYDSTVAAEHGHCGCRYEDPRQEELSHLSYQWTLTNCSALTKSYLGELPFRLDIRPKGGHSGGPKLVLVHGAPTVNTLYWTEERSDDFCRKMAGRSGLAAGDAIAFGHTHLPWHRVVDGVTFINTGSVGRPKDGDPRAGYAVVEIPADDDPTPAGAESGNLLTPRVRIERVAYDVDAAARGILASELPDEFAHYLRSGGASLEPPAT